jgi:hypothetical protein
MAEPGGFAGARLIGRANLRRQRRGIVAVMLLVAFAGAVVVATAAGARRTASAYSRFTAFSHPAEAEVFFTDATPAQLADFGRDPRVGDFAPLRQYVITADQFGDSLPSFAAPIDDRFGTLVDRPRVIRGRAADNDRVDEITLSEDMARRLRLDIGDTFEGDSITPSQVAISRRGEDPGPPAGPHLSLHIVGIMRRPFDLAPRGSAGGFAIMTRAFNDKYQDEIGTFAGTVVRMRPATPGHVEAAIDAARERFGNNDVFGVQGFGVESDGVTDSIDVLVVALALFALIAGAASIVFITIIVSRQTGVVEAEQPQLAALGVTRRNRMLGAFLPIIPVIVGGAALGTLGAALASRFFPIGLARRAEINPGFNFDWAALMVGFVAIAAASAAIGAVVAWRVSGFAGARRAVPRPSRVAQFATRAGWPLTTATGVRFAFENRRGVPARSAVVGAVLGVAGLAAVAVFGASLNDLVATPARYGWTMGVAVQYQREGNPAPGECGADDPRVRDDPQFATVTTVCLASVTVDGRGVDAWGFRPLKGDAGPAIVRGRAAETPTEVTLGRTTLDAIGKDVGDTVTVASGDVKRSYRIVGQQVLPYTGNIDSPLPIADNAGFTAAGLIPLQGVDEENGNFEVFASFAPGRGVSSKRDPESGLPLVAPDVRAVQPFVPPELDRMEQVDTLPWYLGAFLAFLGLAAVTHALVTSARRRRRDVAVLRALGFRRRQVRASIDWQATAIALVGLAIGLPIGTFIGNAVWTRIADGLGVTPAPALPILAFAVIGAAALLVVNGIAMFTARRATRSSPAEALAAE